MPLALVSDAVWLALIAAPLTAFTIWMNWKSKKAVDEAVAAVKAANELSAKASAVVVKVEAAVIKVDETKLAVAGLSQVTNDTHTLVNSQHGAQLKLGAELSRWKAEQTKEPNDLLAADLAEQKYKEHVAKQAIVNGAVTVGPAKDSTTG